MSTATAGRAREHKVRDHMCANGWRYVMRSAGSKGPADLFMAHPFDGGALVQVGTASKSIGPDARDRFVTLATLAGCVPLLATVTRGAVTYWHVTRDIPSTWQRWEL